MGLDEIQRELFNKQKEQQIKYVYYVIALCVSAVGYSVYVSVGHSFNLLLLLWLLPLLSWGTSIYFGLLFLRNSVYNIETEMQWIYLQKALSNNLDDEAKNEVTKMSINREIEQSENLQAGRKHFKIQSRLFFWGIFLFVVWHITEIWFNAFYK